MDYAKHAVTPILKVKTKPAEKVATWRVFEDLSNPHKRYLSVCRFAGLYMKCELCSLICRVSLVSSRYYGSKMKYTCSDPEH